MASIALFLLSVLSLGQGVPTPASIPAARQAKNVAVITIRGEINALVAQSFTRRLSLAQRAGADAIVVELDTPGGEVPAVLAITTALKSASTGNTVAWINPTAYSGGAVIAWACREIVAAPNASVGDARPIMPDPDKLGQWKVVEGKLLIKVLPPIMADLVDSARRFGRDEYLVQALAIEGVELWLIREKSSGRLLTIDAAEYQRLFGHSPVRGLPRIPAVSAQPAQSAAPIPADPSPPQQTVSVPPDQQYRPASPELEPMAREVDRQLDKRGGAPPTSRPVLTAADAGNWELIAYLTNGSGPIVLKHDDLNLLGLSAATIATDDELKAFFGATHLTRLEPSWSEGLVAFLTWMPVRGVLLVIFLLALFIEMTSPGAVLPGAVAFLALIGLIAPPMLINLSTWWAAAAIIVGIALIIMEVLVIPGFGIFGVAGLLFLFGGLMGVLVPAGSLFPDTATERRDLLYGVVTLALALATSGVGIYFISRHFGSLPVLSRLVLQDPTWDDETPGDDLLAAMADPGGPVKRGMTGVSVTPLRPAGRIELADDGRLIDAVSEMGYIPAGSRVRVVSVSDFRIGVERIDDPPGPGSPSAERPA